MQLQRVKGIPQGFTFGYRVKPKTGFTHKGREAANTASTLCANAFLTATIEPIRPSDEYAAAKLRINLNKSYAYMLDCFKRFLKMVGMKFDFKPSSEHTKWQNLGRLIDYFEVKISSLGLSLMISKKDCTGSEADVLQCVVYRPGTELEDTIVIFYCAPARYMSEKGSKMFKQFMKFLSVSMNIPLGLSEHSDNFFLDLICNYDYEEETFFDELHPVIKEYQKGGEFWTLFEEIDKLPMETPEGLYQALADYRRECPSDECELVEAMLEGVDVVKDANCYWFEFNPDDDGITDSDYCDESFSAVLSSAILYSDSDGISDNLLEYVNNEVSAGIMFSTWNIHQWLSPKMKEEDIQEFIRCKDLCASLDVWINKFYWACKKFDLYEQSK